MHKPEQELAEDFFTKKMLDKTFCERLAMNLPGQIFHSLITICSANSFLF